MASTRYFSANSHLHVCLIRVSSDHPSNFMALGLPNGLQWVRCGWKEFPTCAVAELSRALHRSNARRDHFSHSLRTRGSVRGTNRSGTRVKGGKQVYHPILIQKVRLSEARSIGLRSIFVLGIADHLPQLRMIAARVFERSHQPRRSALFYDRGKDRDALAQALLGLRNVFQVSQHPALMSEREGKITGELGAALPLEQPAGDGDVLALAGFRLGEPVERLQQAP